MKILTLDKDSCPYAQEWGTDEISRSFNRSEYIFSHYEQSRIFSYNISVNDIRDELYIGPFEIGGTSTDGWSFGVHPFGINASADLTLGRYE